MAAGESGTERSEGAFFKRRHGVGVMFMYPSSRLQSVILRPAISATLATVSRRTTKSALVVGSSWKAALSCSTCSSLSGCRSALELPAPFIRRPEKGLVQSLPVSLIYQFRAALSVFLYLATEFGAITGSRLSL